MVRDYFDFSPRSQPYLVRANYLHELRSSATYPLAAAMAEGSFAAVVAQKYFDAPPMLVAVIVAAPMFGNLAALLWADLAERRPKVRFVNALQVGVIACTAAVALTYFLPRQQGAYAFAALMVAARLLASGIVTTKSVIWRFNFPKEHRGRIVARVTVISTLVFTATTYAGSRLLDLAPGGYAALYLACALLGLVGVWQYSAVRVRGEGSLLAQLARERRPRVSPVRHLLTLVRESAELLRQDKHFRQYQRYQFLQGSAFMAQAPMLLLMVGEEMTDPRGQYNLATVIVHTAPQVVSVICLQVWAVWFDRMNIVRFRAAQSVAASVTHLTVMAGALTNQLWLVALGMVLMGVAQAGGNLAWNLGQNAFASPERVGSYMGVHVMLTGVRGMFMPFVGVLLYRGVDLRWLGLPYANDGLGRPAFTVCAGLCLLATVGYVRMMLDTSALRRDAEAEPIAEEVQPEGERVDG